MATESRESRPSKKEFVEFWKTQQSRSAMRAVYPLSCLMVVAFVAIAGVSVDPTEQWATLYYVGLIVVLVTIPFGVPLYSMAKYRRFIRCSNCGFWIGADLQGKDALARKMTEPVWLKVARTVRCIRCGTELIVNEGAEKVSGTFLEK